MDAAQVYAQVANLVTRLDQRDASMTLWLTLPKDGGANSDGMVTFTTIDGSTYTFPCLQKLVSQMAKGEDAAQDLAFFFPYNFAANEVIGSFIAASDITYDVVASFAKAKTAPSSQAVITILMDNNPWGTITFAAGQTVGVISIPNPTQQRGQTLDFIAPASVDLNFTGVGGTLAGAII